jgi:peroxiredoxin
VSLAPRVSRRSFTAAVVTALASASMPRRAQATAGARAPAFRLRSVPGTVWRGTFDLAEHLGKRPVVVTFFATWCRPCNAELPFLQKLHAQHQKRGLVIVAVSIDGPDSAVEISGMARRLGVSFPVLHDADSRVSGRYNPRAVAPLLVAIARNGRIAHEHEGWNAAHEKAVPAEVEALLREGGQG